MDIKFHSQLIYDKKYIKAKVREFDGIIKTNLLGNKVPKENIHYTCIACLTNDSVVIMDKKYFPQVYLEECKYKIKKIHVPRFKNIELESESKPESELESDAELMEKLKSDFDSDYE